MLTGFTAQAVLNRDALLTWSTASELNSAYFDIERSFDGSRFTTIGQVAAHGTTATGPVYYRLRQRGLHCPVLPSQPTGGGLG